MQPFGEGVLIGDCLGVALAGSSRYARSGLNYLPLHAVTIALILVLALAARRGRWFRFAHDWYPIFIFIAAFEEIAKLSLVFIPSWRDAILLRAEAALFPVEPNVWLGRWHGLLTTEVLEFGYFTFYWILPVVGGVLYPEVLQTETHEAAIDSRIEELVAARNLSVRKAVKVVGEICLGPPFRFAGRILVQEQPMR